MSIEFFLSRSLPYRERKITVIYKVILMRIVTFLRNLRKFSSRKLVLAHGRLGSFFISPDRAGRGDRRAFSYIL
jgi:hypothetical protein